MHTPHSFPELEALPEALAEKTRTLLGTNNWMGLALHLPLRFEDRSTIAAMDSLSAGQKVNLTGTVVAQEEVRAPRKQFKVWVEDGDSRLLLRWMHVYPGLAAKMPLGAQLKISGQIRQGFNTLEIVHPTITRLASSTLSSSEHCAPQHNPVSNTNAPIGILEPVYPSSATLKQADWKRWMRQLPAACYEDTLPASALKRLKLPDWNTALHTLHGQASPQSLAALNSRTHPAWARIKFDELLAQQLLFKQFRAQKLRDTAPPLSGSHACTTPQTDTLKQRFLKLLGFQLTQAQHRAIAEIESDLALPHPMQRLLQGDVGSGKTVVAMMACLHAIESGTQATFLAPTEVLAAQHHFKLKALCDQLGIRCALLQGSLKKKEKTSVLQAMAHGELDLVIGTHALVQDNVEFSNLGLVIVDEQHRFGVAQRLKIINKSRHGTVAHQLMMSATPIPRTLAQTCLADLQVSNLDEKPPGRKPIVTKLLSDKKRDQLIAAMEHEIAQGQQVYWVCPLIEESEKLDLQAAQATFELLEQALPNARVGLLHGKQDSKTKQDTMARFAQGELDLLVSTTVIEVGVDVSNASLMVIDQAERFGLAQLHQLRGRVGRGSVQSVCVLVYGAPLSYTAKCA
ncbi:MAG: ATP-dependent DNA helicase RecG [Limnobacter sp.]|nr:ATP-dependent DNA helicase RecG [Limnobacter sp.]